MTIAEIHGKLSPNRPKGAHERMEDLLTSDVFSTMKYVGWEKGFLSWLLEAEAVPIIPLPRHISDYLKKSIIDIEYSFWPELANKREPDVALLLCFDSEDYLLVLIEAKYFSGTSNWEGDQDTDQYGRTGNQIVDQVIGLDDMSNEDLLKKWFPETSHPLKGDKGVQKIHLFITMHNSLPSPEYKPLMNYLKKQRSRHLDVECYWLSWLKLAELLENHRKKPDKGLNAILNDLCKLLQKKDLVPFDGFKIDPWQGQKCTYTFWNETWWDQQAIEINNYQSFWNGGK